ncbi:MAG: SMC-Scp complex subunit ScpB [Candidatus Doudnabacteria bacterium RIFCSPLOWO2_02_FULL_48_8]|uniref:SMC-Scp complex subunit ScpB n=1 Tax=Candidatus Doudnabacteria bacterium RIFCSPHIGHO2_01_FULL_46_24 TaxID=1817825 RepID=A0A1F5NU74_9BACT|nr:MAG: SMC-Scp complex subunit ScpB [Candidatus Doudnabacteria bacterium RIFCSPHIGHO2_01_FULL_46_24]OGE94955.1 MAG: SMC-Scp complex subunit ScpB [Candidatus Doudnabacteria bacterium RIFCSPLOWO2_02_FULL_48_8]
MDPTKLKSQILSILFVSAKPVTVKELAGILEMEPEAIKQAAAEIAAGNVDSGIVLLVHDDRLQLSTNPDNSSIVKRFLSAELREKLTDAALETLAVVAYRQPVSRAEIENIRGINSQYILRQLLIRGLIEKEESPTDRRVHLYKTTLELLQHLGLMNISELPDFEELTKNIQLPNAGKSSE